MKNNSIWAMGDRTRKTVKPSTVSTKPSISVSNTRYEVKDLYDSLTALKFRSQTDDSLFEQQLGGGENINALTYSVPGERRSYPRATAKVGARQEMKNDLQSYTSHYVNGGYPSNLRDGGKSNSYTDIHQSLQHYNAEQQKLSMLVSRGYDKVWFICFGIIHLVLAFCTPRYGYVCEFLWG